MPSASTTTIAPTAGIRFTVASRPMRRFTNTQTIDNTAATSFAPISLSATGFVRRIEMKFTQTTNYASAGAIVAGDGPWNVIAGITLTDATGQSILQPISGYNLFLLNKYFSSGGINQNTPRWESNPHMGPEFAFASTATVGTAIFRLSLDLEQDYDTGYGCIPNLDSNASLLLRIDAAASSVAFTGTTIGVVSLAVRINQHYWAPVGATTGGIVNRTTPIGFGDFVETRYETQTVTASAENVVPVNNRGGLIRGIIAVSRAAGVRTAYTAASNVGLVYDNNAIDEGIPLEHMLDEIRRTYGYLGAAITTSYAPITAGQISGIETGVLVWNFGAKSAGRDSWLSTRVGTLLQLKVTPGAAATQLELITPLAQVKDAEAFYYGNY